MTTLANEPKTRPSRPATTATVSGFMGSEAYRCRPSEAGRDPQTVGAGRGGPPPRFRQPLMGLPAAPGRSQRGRAGTGGPEPYVVPVLMLSLIQKQVPL